MDLGPPGDIFALFSRLAAAAARVVGRPAVP
jgi:hypothetical protein